MNEQNRIYKLEHLEEEREKGRQRAAIRRAVRGEEMNEYNQLWRKNNPERLRELNHKYRIAVPEKRKEYQRNRTAKKREAGGTITAAEATELFRKYNYTCLCCGRREPEIKITLDHVVP